MITAVTGGTGFIGRHLVTRLLREGFQVRLLLRSVNKASSLRSQGELEIYSGDLTDKTSQLGRFTDGAYILFHCAGEVRLSDRMYQTHIVGIKNLIAAAKYNIRHWVQLSSVGVYGSKNKGMVLETTSLNPRTVYEKTKALADNLLVHAAEQGLFDYTILRPSIVYGPEMTTGSMFQMISMINKGLFFFIGKPGAFANYIHVNNVIDALILCGGRKTKNNIYNLSDHRKLEDFVATISHALNKSFPKLRVPESPLRLLVKGLQKIPLFPLTETAVDALTNRSFYSTDKIVTELGYKYKISMEEGLRQLVRTWKNCVSGH